MEKGGLALVRATERAIEIVAEIEDVIVTAGTMIVVVGVEITIMTAAETVIVER